MTIIAPSVLSMDYTDTKSQLMELEKSEAKWLHFDVMDGHFVPNLTFGVDILKAMKKSCSLLMDVHVMIEEPKRYAEMFVEAGAKMYTFHYEALRDKNEILDLVEFLHQKGCKAGISIKPNTPVSVLDELLPYFDLVLVMSVEPGFGGQKFDPRALDKIAALRKQIDEKGLNCLIEVDGGINKETAKVCKEAGVDVLVAGSYVFKQDICQGVKDLL